MIARAKLGGTTTKTAGQPDLMSAYPGYGVPCGVEIVPEDTDPSSLEESTEAAMFLENLAKTFIEALAVTAGASAGRLKDLVISLQAPAERAACFRQGINITVEGACFVAGLEELVLKASKLCFGEGTGMCPVRYNIQERR